MPAVFKRSICLFPAMLVPAVMALHAQARAAEPATPEEANIDTVVIVGQRGGPPRTVLHSPAPVDVILAQQLDASAYAEPGEVLAKTLPSLNFGTTMVGVVSIVRPVSNRSLGPAYTLVLVNGKRRHNGSLIINGGGDTSGVNPVDLDLIPFGGVARIEVLKDSAAAQYGTDAVAGVLDIRLDRRASGVGGSLSIGSLTDGGGDRRSWKADVRAGYQLGRNGGFLSLFADSRKRGGAWWPPLALDTNLYGLPAGRSVAQVAAAAGLTPSQVQSNIAEANARNAAWDRIGTHNGNAEIKAWNLGYNAEAPLDNGLTLYSFSTYGERDTVIGNNLRRPNSTANFSAQFPNGYFPLNNTHEYDFQVVAGARGQKEGWTWDYSASYGRNRNHQFSELSVKPALGPTGPTYWPDLATFRFSQWVHNLDATRSFDWGLAAPVQMSAGIEYRIDRFETFAGAELAWRADAYIYKPGDQQYDWNVGLAASPVVQAAVVLSPSDEADLTRRASAAYLDVGLQPSRRWYVGLALRAEHYSDFGGRPIGVKLNSRFDLNERFALRGTLGTGFRAPSLTQMAYAQTDGRTAVVVNPQTGQSELIPNVAKLVTAASAVGRLLGAEPLKAEKTWNAGAGVVWRPAPDFSLTADAYYIRVRDRIARTGRLSGTKVSAILAANDLTQVQAVEYFINAVDTDTTGLDLVADYDKTLGRWGRLSLNAAFNYSETNITGLRPTPARLLDANGASILGPGSEFFGPDRMSDIEEMLPHARAIVNGVWTNGPFTANLKLSWYGEYTWRLPATDERRFGAKTLTDMDVSYAIGRVRLAIGANNLFDIMPELNGAGSPQSGQGYYGPSAYSPNGAYYYTRLAYSL